MTWRLSQSLKVGVFFVVVGAMGVDTSMAQPVNGIPEQRQRLTAEREEALRYFDAQDAQCKSQFAVTGCLKDINRQRLARLYALKKAENRLQDIERQQRGAEQLRQLEDRVTGREKQAKEAGDARVLDDQSTRDTRENAAKRPSAQPRSGQPAGDALTKAGISTTEQRDNRNAYEAKQLEAEKKRLERDKRLREQKPSMLGLPAAP